MKNLAGYVNSIRSNLGQDSNKEIELKTNTSILNTINKEKLVEASEEDKQDAKSLISHQPSEGSLEDLKRDQAKNESNIVSGEIIFQNESQQGYTASVTVAEDE